MGYNIIKNPTEPVKDLPSWASKYKDQQIEHSHDQSMFTLVNPDDSVMVIGPPRLEGDVSDLYPIGFIQSMQYSESSQVQPFKSIGSRRHIYSKTNAPVQGSISRMMVLGDNLYRALYSLTQISSKVAQRNPKFAVGDGESASAYTNLEEDVFRYTFGLGIIWNSPATAVEESDQSVSAEYIESCTLVNRQVSLQSGQALVMESVSFMADRVIPWVSYKGPEFAAGSFTNHANDMVG